MFSHLFQTPESYGDAENAGEFAMFRTTSRHCISGREVVMLLAHAIRGNFWRRLDNVK